MVNLKKYRPGQIIRIGSVLPYRVKITGYPVVVDTFHRTMIPVWENSWGNSFVSPNEIH